MKNLLLFNLSFVLLTSNAIGNQPTVTENRQPEAVILPGVEIALNVYREDDLKQRVKVGHDGKVKLHLIDPVRVIGLTQRQVEKLIQETYSKDILVNPSVSVSIHPKPKIPGKITIDGRVGSPGNFAMPKDKGSIGIVEALGLAGGFTRLSNRTNVNVRRDVNGTSALFKVNVKKIQSDPRAENFKILPGDIIVVWERWHWKSPIPRAYG